MREKLARFMAGRYGGDYLNRFLSITGCILIVLSIFTTGLCKGYISLFLWVLSLAILIWSNTRIFSRDVYKRRAENEKYLRTKYKVDAGLRLRKERWQQRKDYKFFTCPSCKTTLRVPKGKGKINIMCRKCGNSFQGKT